MEQQIADADRTQAEFIVGSWRRIGETGPIYEVLGTGSSIIRGPTVKIRFPESGEVIDYPLADLLEDQREA